MKICRRVPPREFLHLVQDPLAVKTITTNSYDLRNCKDPSITRDPRKIKRRIEIGELNYYEYLLAPSSDLEEATQMLAKFFLFEKMTSIPIVELPFIAGVTYEFKNAEIAEIRFSANMQTDRHSAHTVSIYIDNCRIARLLFQRSIFGVTFHATRSWIGMLDITKQKFQEFRMLDCGLLLLKCPPPYADNPFVGSAIFDNVYLPRRDGAYRNVLSGYQP